MDSEINELRNVWCVVVLVIVVVVIVRVGGK